jgi:deaminated glutathione amidase
LRIALLQMTSGIDPARNAAGIEKAVAEAGREGAKILFTPEMSGLLDRNRERAAQSQARQADDIVLANVRAAAKTHGIWVSLGSLAIKGEREDGRLVNRSFMIDDLGEIRAHYDKIHLFDVDLPTGESWRESNAYGPGEGTALVQTPCGAMGLSICYDIRFPGLYQQLSAAGAEILTVPAAFTVPTGKVHWHILLRARAIENACWVIAAAQTGRHEDGRDTFGHSLVIDPWGEIVLDMGSEAGIGFAEVDLDRVKDARSRIPVIAHRRPIAEVKLSK